MADPGRAAQRARRGVRRRRRALGDAARRLDGRARARGGAARAVVTVLASVTPLGRTLAGLAVVAWWLGARLGWDELLIVAGACLVALVLGLASTIGRLGLDVELGVDPVRVAVGGEAVGLVRARNHRTRPTLGARVEVPVGAGVAAFDVGVLRPGGEHEEPFVVPTRRRAVVSIGPARSVKGDALGIARREVVSGGAVELFVHPRTTVLPPLRAGRMRDLEGITTNDLSSSDVAFHTLREYVPGDDRRHVHWRTSARLGTLMVRQFVDTRRSHLGVVLSERTDGWADDEEFELGVSAVGSLGRTALLGGQEVTALTGARPLPTGSPTQLLDALAAVERDDDGPTTGDLVVRTLPSTAAASVVVLVVGSTVAGRTLRAACDHYGADVDVLALRCRPGAEPGRRRSRNVSVLEIGRLDDLARVLAVAAATS